MQLLRRRREASAHHERRRSACARSDTAPRARVHRPGGNPIGGRIMPGGGAIMPGGGPGVGECLQRSAAAASHPAGTPAAGPSVACRAAAPSCPVAGPAGTPSYRADLASACQGDEAVIVRKRHTRWAGREPLWREPLWREPLWRHHRHAAARCHGRQRGATHAAHGPGKPCSGLSGARQMIERVIVCGGETHRRGQRQWAAPHHGQQRGRDQGLAQRPAPSRACPASMPCE